MAVDMQERSSASDGKSRSGSQWWVPSAVRWLVLVSLATYQATCSWRSNGRSQSPAEDVVDGARSSAAETIVVEVADMRFDDQTERAVKTKLLERLRVLAEKLSNRELSETQLQRDYYWLINQPGVKHHQEETIDPLTGRRQVKLTLDVPADVLTMWTKRIGQHQSAKMRTVVGGVLGTGAFWIVGILLTMFLDRWTLGYRRQILLPGSLLVLLGTSVAFWWYLCEAVLKGL